MAVRFITVAQVRTYLGIDSTQVSDNDVTSIIEDVEFRVEKELNSKFAPTTEIEVQDGNEKSIIYSRKGPLLALRYFKVDGTELTVSTLGFARSGRIWLTPTADTGRLIGKRDAVVLKYVYGMLEGDTAVSTTSTNAEAAGTSVTIEVASSTGIVANDWVEIYGTDGYREVAQVSSVPGGTSIIVGELSYSHVAGSIVRKMSLNGRITQLLKIEAALQIAIRMSAQSFDDVVGYSIGTFQVQKGEPYTQWREATERLKQERDLIKKQLQPFPSIYV